MQPVDGVKNLLDGIKSIDQMELEGARVFIRVDFNVPMENGRITDDTRIRATLPTIQLALDRGAKVILGSHFGRPKGQIDEKYSLEPIAKEVGDRLKSDVLLVEEPHSQAPRALLSGLKRGELLMLENLRFDPGEESNDRELATRIASYTDIYINDAFGASHRPHMSIVSLPEVVEKRGIGLLMRKEIEMLGRIRFQPPRPFVAIIGGAKVSDKIEVLELLVEKADQVIVGGAMAYTFLAAMGVPIGNSRVEKDKIRFTQQLLERMKAKGRPIHLPVDHRVVSDIRTIESLKVSQGQEILEGQIGVDIGPRTQEFFSSVIDASSAVFWNGPMGIFETPAYAQGTFAVAEAIAKSQSFSVVGGGDSAAAAHQSGLAEGFSHISTGGGASLEFIQGLRLPGLEVLRPAKRSEKVEL